MGVTFRINVRLVFKRATQHIYPHYTHQNETTFTHHSSRFPTKLRIKSYLVTYDVLDKQIERIDIMEWKMLVCFEYENGKTTMADYNELKDVAERHNIDVDEFITNIGKSIRAESYTIISSRLLD